MIVKVNPNFVGYTPEQLAGSYRRLQERLSQIPGVMSASLSLDMPMSGNNRITIVYVDEAGVAPQRKISWNRVSPGYFETIGTRLRQRVVRSTSTIGPTHGRSCCHDFARGYSAGDLGIAIGFPLAVGAARFLQHQLFGISTYDPATLAGAVLVLGGCAVITAQLPARRAVSIDPMRALRIE